MKNIFTPYLAKPKFWEFCGNDNFGELTVYQDDSAEHPELQFCYKETDPVDKLDFMINDIQAVNESANENEYQYFVGVIDNAKWGRKQSQIENAKWGQEQSQIVRECLIGRVTFSKIIYDILEFCRAPLTQICFYFDDKKCFVMELDDGTKIFIKKYAPENDDIAKIYYQWCEWHNQRESSGSPIKMVKMQFKNGSEIVAKNESQNFLLNFWNDKRVFANLENPYPNF